MISSSVLALFVPTFFLVSATPGMCMTLALTLGITLGVRRTLWMMLGELVGVALVALATLFGIASIMLLYPLAFTALKFAGGAYLLFLGGQLWYSRGALSINSETNNYKNASKQSLIIQGLVTAIANPKGWAFLIALLPPFIDRDKDLFPQLVILIAIMLLIEFICLLIYALGGKALRHALLKKGNVIWINRFTGILMMAIAIWLISSS